jgi:hypothetical protein
MSHNRRTLQDLGSHVLERLLTQQNGGPGVTMQTAVTPAAYAESGLPTRRFVVAGTASCGPCQPNLQQPARSNKTVGLVAWEGADAGGN